MPIREGMTRTGTGAGTLRAGRYGVAEQRIHADYALHLVEHGEVLEVRVSGGVDAQEVRIAYWQEIAELGKERGIRKLLVMDRKKGQPATPAELAELAVLFQHEARHFERVAVIEPTPEFLPAVEYAEIFGQGLGINVRIFSERREAERWLRYGSPDDGAVRGP